MRHDFALQQEKDKIKIFETQFSERTTRKERVSKKLTSLLNCLCENNESLQCAVFGRLLKIKQCLTFMTPSPIKILRNFHHAQVRTVAYLKALRRTGKGQIAMEITA